MFGCIGGLYIVDLMVKVVKGSVSWSNDLTYIVGVELFGFEGVFWQDDNKQYQFLYGFCNDIL